MIRILTLNTWHGHSPKSAWSVARLEPAGHKERRTAALVAGLRALDPDVVMLQECFPQPIFTTRVADALGYDHATKICNAGVRIMGFGLPPGIGNGEGVSILAKRHLKMRVAGVRRLSGVGFATGWLAAQLGQLRFAIAAEIESRGKKVMLFNTHLRYAYPTIGSLHRAWHELKERGVISGEPGRALVELVRHNMRVRDHEVWHLLDWVMPWVKRNVPVVIGADFNLDHDHDQMRTFTMKLGALNVLPTLETRAPWTWDPLGNPNIAFSTKMNEEDGQPKSVMLQLAAHYDTIRQNPDHLLLGPSFGSADLEDGGLAMNTGHEGVFASDHYGIWADVRL